METQETIIKPDDRILVTGAFGFLGMRVLGELLRRGYRNIRCVSRSSGYTGKLRELSEQYDATNVEVIPGNLTSPDDCARATGRVAAIYHLAAGRGSDFANVFMNSVVGTRNLLHATVKHGDLKRFVNISSFSVYSNRDKTTGDLLDESCPIEDEPAKRGDAY